MPAVAVLLLAAAQAQADPARATAFFEKGTRHYQVGEYQQAIEQFKAGHLEDPDPSFIFNIAQCQRQLGQTKEALISYRRFLTMDPDTPLRADVERKMAALEDGLKREVPDGQAGVSPGVPLAFPLRSGTNRDPASTVTTGTTGTTTHSGDATPTGASAPRSRLPLWVGGALTVALAGGATALGVTTNRRFESLRDSCGHGSANLAGCPAGDIDEVRTRAITVNVLWVAAGLAAVGTGAWIYVSRERAAVSLSMKF